MFANAGKQTGSIPEASVKAGSPSTDAESLLKALRNVIIPLIRSTTAEDNCDTNPYALGPGGEEFVSALQKFMTSFLLSQQGSVGGVEVQLEASNTSHDDHSPTDIAHVPMETESLSKISSSEGNEMNQEDVESNVEVHNEKTPNGLEVSRMDLAKIDFTATFEERLRHLFLEKLLKKLREHVFNAMPIRLLCFKVHDSKLQITLIERGTIYAHIASNLKTTFSRSESFPHVIYPWGQRETDKEAISRLILQYSRYAILSHTWLRNGSGEVIYSDWNRGEFDVQKPGYQKLVNFCKAAWEDHGVAFGWMDTVCINKESSSELDESIRSMYKWYRDAHICVTYLADTATLSDMHRDTWFTRGWTLQELIAPTHMKFYNAAWKKLVESSKSDKENSIILDQIEQATTITADELRQPEDIIDSEHLPISRKMQIAAMRQVTREEDIAYSLMGIFNVSIATAYGEGAERAFSRLLQEIFNSSANVVDMFNWAGSFGSGLSSLLPPTPQGYLHCSSTTPQTQDISQNPIEPFMLTHVGLRVTMILMPALKLQSIENPSSRYDSIGDYHAIANVPLHADCFLLDDDMPGGGYSVLDAEIHADGWNEKENIYPMTLGVLNIGNGENSKISIPKHCLAVALRYSISSAFKFPTETPVVFNLNKVTDFDENENMNDNDSDMYDDYYDIERSELTSHGMRLVTLYL